ncbi:MAG TPA: PaaI family thioesterase [Anaeromyxobacteraceae bacterium]|nr:PaaI family thioesterase [Anaeromyxobacteraceae bacterium]
MDRPRRADRDLASYFRRDRFAALAGVRLVEVRPGFARARMRVSDRTRNANGVAMGGAVFTLADLAFAACSNARGRVAVAVQVSISYHKAGSGLLTAEAREIARTTRLSSCAVRVTDRTGDLVATFQGLAYVTSGEVPLPAPRRRPARMRARIRRE